MAQISDVVHALAVFDAARQELAWAYSGDFAEVPEPMKGAVHTISEVLNEAEMRWGTSTTVVTESQQIQDWLMRLKVIAYDMRAVARKELIEDRRIDDKLSARRWLPCVPRGTKIARKTTNIDAVTAKLEELRKEYEKFGYTTGLPLATTCRQESCVEGKEDTTVVTADVLVGRDDEKNMIINYITANIGDKGDKDPPIIFPIVGAPCVGKTALVKSVIHDPRFQDDCYVKVWVDMGKGWDIEKICRCIIEVFGENNREYFLFEIDTVRERPSVKVRNMLLFHKKQVLLVLDDMVNEDLDYWSKEKESRKLQKLYDFLYEIRSYVVTIVTTRSEAMAKKMSQTLVQLQPYRLHQLSDDWMYWEIIKRTGGALTSAALPVMIGRELASKCSGLPLAAKVIGHFLQSVNPQEWPRARDIWNFKGGFSRDSQLSIHSTIVFTHLKRSSHLQTESWLSFAYCAFFIFPKSKGGHGIVIRDLLNQWCSLRLTTSQHGGSCILQLLDQSLLRENKPTSTVAESFVIMEDLMHDFARYLLGDRLIVVDGRNGATPPSSPVNNNKSSNAYLALVSNLDANQSAVISSILPAGILALRFVDCREIELSAGEFASAKYSCVRLLDLSGCNVTKLPHSIRHLKQLRYLNAPGIQDEEFPRPITWLHELRYLNLRGSRGLSNLTEAFQRLVNLRDLNLSGCSGLQALPDSFGRLGKLEHLDLSACSGIESLPGSFCWLHYLSRLDMSRCSGLKVLPESFGKLRRLQHLDLSCCSRLQYLPLSMQALRMLEHLNLSGSPRLEALPMLYLPTFLRHLNLSGCIGLVQLPDALEHPELQHLDLSGCRRLGTELPFSYSRLQKLEHLNLSGSPRLQELPMQSLPTQLRQLNLSGCTGLVKLPDAPENSELQHLDLSGCRRLGTTLPSSYSGLRKLVHLNLSASNLERLPDVCQQLLHLDLSYCWWLKEMPAAHWLQNLQYLDLSGCFQLQVPYGLVDSVRSRGRRASGPEDASLSAAGTNGTINLSKSHSICDGDPMFRPSPDYLDMFQMFNSSARF